MIIKLPIIVNNKVINTTFKLIKYDNYLLLSILEKNIIEYNSEIIIENNLENSLIKILLCNNINGISYLNIYFPLKLFIIDSYVISIYFFIVALSSNLENNLDFFYNLNNIIKNKFNLELIKYNNIKVYQEKILEIINNEYINLTSNNKFNKEFWEMINLLLNCSGYIISLDNSTKKISKRIISIANNIKNINYSINYSNKYNIVNHLKNINNNSLKLSDIKINDSYYLLINNKKIIYVKILEINSNLILLDFFKNSIIFENYKWFIYPPDTKISINNIYITLLNNQETYRIIINKYYSKLNSEKIDNIINYFLINQYKSNLILFILENNSNDQFKTDIQIIKQNSFSQLYFYYICSTYTENNIILEAFFNNYVYPIKYNKKEIDSNFDYILYYSTLNIKSILNIDKDKYFLNNEINNIVPSKLKSLYFNILKIFSQLINDNYTNKLITDNMLIQFIKIFLSSESLTFNLLLEKISTKQLNNFKNSLLTIFTINDIISRLSWTNINKRLHYLNILLNNKNYLYFYDKLNKNLFPDDFDLRIKTIINNPYEMFKFLRRDSDFIKWLYFLEDRCSELYIVPFELTRSDLDILGKIIFNLLYTKEQNFNDRHYKKLLYYGIKCPKLILNNFRINLKIKENFGFLKCNINLGILAKHLSQNKDNIIELSDENSELEILKNSLKEITEKYIKYKRKYKKYKLKI
jgi:hypothetical protein